LRAPEPKSADFIGGTLVLA